MTNLNISEQDLNTIRKIFSRIFLKAKNYCKHIGENMKEKVDLSGVTETMLVPLYSRALEAERKNPQFIDETAVKVMDSLDYDFKKKFKDSTNKMNFWGCCARTVGFYPKESGLLCCKYWMRP